MEACRTTVRPCECQASERGRAAADQWFRRSRHQYDSSPRLRYRLRRLRHRSRSSSRSPPPRLDDEDEDETHESTTNRPLTEFSPSESSLRIPGSSHTSHGLSTHYGAVTLTTGTSYVSTETGRILWSSSRSGSHPSLSSREDQGQSSTIPVPVSPRDDIVYQHPY